MADSWQVKFTNAGLSGDVLMSASEGEQFFTPGLRRHKKSVEEQALVDGMIVKRGGKSGATHTLKLEFMTTSQVASTVWAAVFDRLQKCHDSNGGTLSVPGYPDFANCCVIKPPTIDDPAEAIAQATPLNSGSTGFTAGWLIKATVEFEQVG